MIKKKNTRGTIDRRCHPFRSSFFFSFRFVRRSAGTRSGEMTPSSSRPQSSMSQSVTGPPSAVAAQPRSRPVAMPRKPRPISIAVTGVTAAAAAASADHAQQLASTKSPASGDRPPLPRVSVTKKSITPKVESKKLPGGDVKQSAAKVYKAICFYYNLSRGGSELRFGFLKNQYEDPSFFLPRPS